MRGCVCGLLGIVVVGVNFVTLASAFSLEAFELVGSAQRTDAGGVRLTHDDDAGAKGIMFAKSIEGRTAWEFQLLLNAHGRKNQGGEGFAFWCVEFVFVSLEVNGNFAVNGRAAFSIRIVKHWQCWLLWCP